MTHKNARGAWGLSGESRDLRLRFICSSRRASGGDLSFERIGLARWEAGGIKIGPLRWIHGLQPCDQRGAA
jgi:hypothetical protein